MTRADEHDNDRAGEHRPDDDEPATRRVRRRWVTVAAAVTALAVGVPIGVWLRTRDGGDGEAAATGKASHVTFTTAFQAAGRDAPVWVALKNGYFKDQNIEVDIQLGSAADKNLTMLASGKAQFAALDSTGALIHYGNNRFTDTRMIAAIHQRTLVSIMTDDPLITSPKDLAGKTIGAPAGSVNQSLYPGYAKLTGVDPESVRFINLAASPTILGEALRRHRVHALSTFLISEKAVETASRTDVRVYPYGDYMSDLYGNALFTTADIATRDPGLVKRFRAAYLQGVTYSIAHPAEAAQILHEYQPATDAGAAEAEVRAMAPYCTPVGELDPIRIVKAIASLQSNGLVPSGLTPEKVMVGAL